MLVVEDNPDQQILIEYNLRGCIPQAEPIMLATVEDVLTHLEKCSAEETPLPGLVFLELHIPHLESGWQLLQELRRSYPKLPVIALSADDRPDTIRRAYDLGIHSFINKPLALKDWQACFQAVSDYWLGTVTLPLRAY